MLFVFTVCALALFLLHPQCRVAGFNGKPCSSPDLSAPTPGLAQTHSVPYAWSTRLQTALQVGGRKEVDWPTISQQVLGGS